MIDQEKLDGEVGKTVMVFYHPYSIDGYDGYDVEITGELKKLEDGSFFVEIEGFSVRFNYNNVDRMRSHDPLIIHLKDLLWPYKEVADFVNNEVTLIYDGEGS